MTRWIVAERVAEWRRLSEAERDHYRAYHRNALLGFFDDVIDPRLLP